MKTPDQFHCLFHGLSSQCVLCLDKLSATHQEKAAAKCHTLIQTLPTLEDFYLNLEAAKNKEPYTHTIPFHSKEGSEGDSTHAMQIASFGGNVLDSDPQTEEGSKAFKIVTERIRHQCREILGYQWRCVLIVIHC